MHAFTSNFLEQGHYEIKRAAKPTSWLAHAVAAPPGQAQEKADSTGQMAKRQSRSQKSMRVIAKQRVIPALAYWEAPAGVMMLGQQHTIVFVRPAQNKAALLQEAYATAQLMNLLHLVSVKHSSVELMCKSWHISVPVTLSKPDTSGHISMNCCFHHKLSPDPACPGLFSTAFPAEKL